MPRIPMIPTDMPFEFKRLQFPVRLAIAMTNYHQQSRGLAKSVWTNFGKSMLLTWTTTVCGLLTRWKTFQFIRVHSTHQKGIRKILNIQKHFNKHN
jgi:hypothetical protein